MEVPINNIGMCGVVHHFAHDQSHEKTVMLIQSAVDLILVCVFR